MATTRLLRCSRPIQLPSNSSSSLVKCVRFKSKASLNNNNNNSGDHSSSTHHGMAGSGKGEIRKPVVAAKAVAASVATTEHVTTTWQPSVIPQVLSNLASIRNAMLVLFRDAVEGMRQWNLNPQMLIERGIIDCRFFTLLAVAGSLLGSVLCFLEGCVLVMESYAHYFHTMSKRLDDQGHLVHLLIEAIDMFLVGTALVVFGVGLYVMFVESRMKKSRQLGWVGMESIGEAKSKIGHAVMMILQVGLLDKFKDIPLLTGFDLACFAAALLTSSASIFLLSRLNTYT